MKFIPNDISFFEIKGNKVFLDSEKLETNLAISDPDDWEDIFHPILSSNIIIP